MQRMIARRSPGSEQLFRKQTQQQKSKTRGKSCIACSEARSTNNITRMKEHLLVCMPYLLSDRAAAIKDDLLQQRVARARAAASGMGQSTLTSSKSSTKRKLMRAFCDELTQSDAKKLKVLFAEMVVATNMPHSWVEHAAVQKCLKALSQRSRCLQGTSSARLFCLDYTQPLPQK